MAQELQKPKPRKKQSIEPLDWSTMAQSPALKGMVSFLEVTPEEVRRQQSKNGDSRLSSDAHTGRDTHTGSESHKGPDSQRAHAGHTASFSAPGGPLVGQGPIEIDSGSDTHTGSEAHTGSDSLMGSGSLTGQSEPTAHPGTLADVTQNGSTELQVVRSASLPAYDHTQDDTHTGSDTLIGSDTHTVSASQPNSDALTGSNRDIGSESHTGSDSHTPKEALATSYARTGNMGRPKGVSHSEDEPPTISDSLIESESLTGGHPHTVSESLTGSDMAESKVRGTDQSGDVYTPKDETRQRKTLASDTPAGTQSRPTSYLGSEQYSRPLRRTPMVQGDVVWQNRKIRRCVLAQDAHSQGEDALFSAMWSAAKPELTNPSGSRTIRIGYAELAQKSRMHRTNVRINITGLRAKLALEILDEHDSRDVMPRLYRLYSYKEILERRRAAGLEFVIRKKSVVFVTETGDLVPLPGLPKPSARRPQRASERLRSEHTDGTPNLGPPTEQLDLDVRQISDAMSQYWPVDEAAAHQLLRQCRSVRRDAEIDEIVFFVNEKLQIALTNKNIKNPTGLVLATVPPCFEGMTFQDFRRRRNEGLRLAAEEQERKRQQERDLQVWLEKEMHTLKATADDESQSDSEREKARRSLKQYAS